MSTKLPENAQTHTCFTFAALIARLEADESLPPLRRRDVVLGLRRFAELFRLPIEALVPSPSQLRTLIAGLSPTMMTMEPGTWRNTRSYLQFALAHAGLASVPGRYRIAPSERWEGLLAPLAYSQRYKLGHIARYCTAAGIEPEQVDDTMMAGLLCDLRDRSLTAEWERVHRDATIAWNRAVAAHPEWPQRRLSVPDNRGYYSLPWDRFAPSLVADVEAWLARLAGADLRSRFKPVRPATIITRRKQVHEYLSALVIEGVKPEEMQRLADVVTPERAATGLMFFWKRAGERPSPHAGHIAGVLLSIAKHYAKLDKATLDELRDIQSRVAVHQTAMTERNRMRLMPLDDPERRRALLKLPGKLREDVIRAGAPTRTLAVQLQTAMAIEVLTMMPIRIENLRSLRLDRHLIFGRDRDDVTIFIPDREVKNGVALECRLPEPSAQLLDLYLTKYRPLLDNPNSPWLFAGQKPDTRKAAETLRHQIKTMIWQRCGLDFRPHTFRHASAKIMLDQNPGAYGQVQRILGHKSIKTTTQFYTGMESKAALAHFDQHILHLRDEEPSIGHAKRQQGRRP